MLALLKTIIFTLVVPGSVTVLIPYLLLPARPLALLQQASPFRHLGLLPMLLGASVYLWCAWDFTFAGRGTPAPIEPPKRLVARGLYRYVRNPMYIGVLLVLLGEAWLFASLTLLIYAGAIFFLFYLFVVFYEEPTLRRKFGESYEGYCEAAPRWIPRIGGKESSPSA